MITILATVLALTTSAPVAAAHMPQFATCGAKRPVAGEAFSGFVLQVMDGDDLCVAKGPTPREWTRIHLAGVPQTSTRGALMAASFAQKVECVALESHAADTVASCSLDGAPLSQIVRRPSVQAAGAAWR